MGEILSILAEHKLAFWEPRAHSAPELHCSHIQNSFLCAYSEHHPRRAVRAFSWLCVQVEGGGGGGGGEQPCVYSDSEWVPATLYCCYWITVVTVEMDFLCLLKCNFNSKRDMSVPESIFCDAGEVGLDCPLRTIKEPPAQWGPLTDCIPPNKSGFILLQVCCSTSGLINSTPSPGKTLILGDYAEPQNSLLVMRHYVFNVKITFFCSIYAWQLR